MNTPQTPVPMSLRCLAILPAIIMLGGYAILGPQPAETSSLAAAAPVSAQHEAPIASLPPVGVKLASVQNADLSVSR